MSSWFTESEVALAAIRGSPCAMVSALDVGRWAGWGSAIPAAAVLDDPRVRSLTIVEYLAPRHRLAIATGLLSFPPPPPPRARWGEKLVGDPRCRIVRRRFLRHEPGRGL